MSICLAILFFSICTIFGFLFLNKINKIDSWISLVPFSISFGVSAYVFTCHMLSFFIGPKNASFLSLVVLLTLSVFIFAYTKKIRKKPNLEISKNKFGFLILLSLVISGCTFISMHKYGLFDDVWHIPLTASIYHNDVYPPRDFFRPDYPLAYHFGGDLFSGAINHLCKINFYNSFEIISGIFSLVTFLSFFVLAWTLTINYKISLLAAFCSYFGAGFTWLNEIIRCLTTLPQGGFLKNFLIRGIHSTIVDAPSIVAFSSTASIGYPVLILCLFFFIELTKKKDFKNNISNFILLTISLFSLSLFAGWLALTFLAGTSVYCIIFFFLKKKQYFPTAVNIFFLFALFSALNKLCGNQMYSKDEFLGRANIFSLLLKKDPFTITTWSGFEPGEALTKTISCFSFEFISAFGLSLILLPAIFIYLKKHKNDFAFLLFLCAALTMPLPIILDFKFNPVDFNRIFGFGNTMLVLLITCSLGTLFPKFLKRKVVLSLYTLGFCLSPLCGLIIGTIFTPRMYLDTNFTEHALNILRTTHSVKDIYKDSLKAKYAFINKYKDEIKFFSKNAKPKDVAISSIPGIPIFSGVYTLIPSMLYGYKGLVYSDFDNIYPTIVSTLDPYLINEFNIKWIAYDEASKNKLSKEALSFLNNKKIFKLAYKNKIKPEPDSELLYEIYNVADISASLKDFERKTSWILVNSKGFPIEIIEKLYNNISIFPSEKNALKYLKKLITSNPRLKNVFITAQPIIIKATEEQLKQNGLTIKLEIKE